MNDEFEGSGDSSIIAMEDDSQSISTLTADTPSTGGSFNLSPYRVGWVASKAILFILVAVLTVASRRDFIRVFLLLLLLPIFGEIVFDVFTEIKANFAGYDSTLQHWDYFWGVYYDEPVRNLPGKALDIYENITVHYSSYTIFSVLYPVKLISFILTDLLFWGLLLYSVVLLHFTHRAILKPEETPYIPFWPPFVRVAVVVLLLTGADTLFVLIPAEDFVAVALSALVKIAALLAGLTILFLLLISPFIMCRRKEERTKTSSFVFIRSARSRLLWTGLFLILLHSLSIPYLAWAALSLWGDLAVVARIDQGFPSSMATNAFVLHVSLLPARGVVILLSALFFLPPLGLRIASICGCCSH